MTHVDFDLFLFLDGLVATHTALFEGEDQLLLFDVLGVQGVHIWRYLLVEGVVVTVAVERLTCLATFG